MIKKFFIFLLVIPLTISTDGDKQELAIKYDEKLKIEDGKGLLDETEIRPIELLEPVLDPNIKPIELLEPILDPSIKPIELLEPKISEENKSSIRKKESDLEDYQLFLFLKEDKLIRYQEMDITENYFFDIHKEKIYFKTYKFKVKNRVLEPEPI